MSEYKFIHIIKLRLSGIIILNCLFGAWMVPRSSIFQSDKITSNIKKANETKST